MPGIQGGIDPKSLPSPRAFLITVIICVLAVMLLWAFPPVSSVFSRPSTSSLTFEAKVAGIRLDTYEVPGASDGPIPYIEVTFDRKIMVPIGEFKLQGTETVRLPISDLTGQIDYAALVRSQKEAKPVVWRYGVSVSHQIVSAPEPVWLDYLHRDTAQ